MKQLKGIIISIIAILSIVVAVYEVLVPEETSIKKTNAYDQVLEFPKDRYPETGKHITDAIKEGHSEVCTIDRGDVCAPIRAYIEFADSKATG